MYVKRAAHASFGLLCEEERKMIRVKLMASVSPVALVWVVAGLEFTLRLNNHSAFRLSNDYDMCCVGHCVYN